MTIGNQNVAPTRVAAIPGAVRLGALAIAPAARRLYVADMGAARIYTIELATGAVRAVDVGVEEIRAMSWDGQRKRLFIADSGHETILVVDPNARAPTVERSSPTSVSAIPPAWPSPLTARCGSLMRLDDRSFSCRPMRAPSRARCAGRRRRRRRSKLRAHFDSRRSLSSTGTP